MGCCHSSSQNDATSHSNKSDAAPTAATAAAAEIAMAWNPWLCSDCRNITFFPMKSMTMERWRSYFPFLEHSDSSQLQQEYETRYQKFIDLIQNDRTYEAILCSSRQRLHDNAVDDDCQFCWLLGYIIQTECYWSGPTTPGRDLRAGIITVPPVEWPEDDIDDHRRASPMVWFEIFLKNGNINHASSMQELEGTIITVKLANMLAKPRFLLNNIRQEDSGWDKELENIRESDNHTGSPQNVVLAKRWMAACQKHPNCSSQAATSTSAEMPTRLLDLAAPGLGEDLLLHETVPADKVQYATLSHKWGNNALITTTASNLQQRFTRIYIQSLPLTFRDAIIFSRRMGVRYLWIDSLCIVQDSDDDKGREIPKMASIYGNAVFNIAASAAADATEGLFRERSADLFKPTELPLNFQLADGSRKTCFATLSRLLHSRSSQELRSKLDDRGWIFQERALSRRVFSFEGHMLWFECREMIASESLPRGASRASGGESSSSQEGWLDLLPRTTSRPLVSLGDMLVKAERAKEDNDATLPARIQTLLHHWYRAIPGYLLRSFTDESDRLPAISSLASRISALSPQNTYLAGHFLPNLVISLCWALGGSPSRHSPVRCHPPRAPTWSWACLTGPVRTHCLLLAEHSPREILLEIVDAWTTPTDVNKPFGEVREGGIKMRGWMKKMIAWSAGTPSGSREETWGVARIFELDADFERGGLYMRGGEGRAYMDDVGRFLGDPERREVWVVPIMVYAPEKNEEWQGTWVDGERAAKKVCALVVEEREDGRFERVGFMWRLLLGEPSEWEGDDEDEGTWFEKGKVEKEIVVV